MCENDSEGSETSSLCSSDDEIYMNAAYLCASAIKNGWLSDIVSDSSSTEGEQDPSDSQSSINDCDNDEPVSKKIKTKASERDLNVMTCINTLKPDAAIFTPKLDIVRKKYISQKAFDKIFSLIKKDISKKATFMRVPIPAEDKLAAVIRYIMSGSNFKDIETETKISRPALSLLIPHVCETIINNLSPKYMKLPSSHDEWIEVAADFEAIWNFPLCLGAIDVRHIPVRCGKNEKNIYCNVYKYASIIIVALCDAHGCFLFVDVGNVGRFSDEEALIQSKIQKLISNAGNALPPDQQVGVYSRRMPHVFVADEAFPLEKHLMVPIDLSLWPNFKSDAEAFNMRLKKARKPVDLALGKLWNRFPILQSCILQPGKVAKIVEACCVLHNFFIKEKEADVDPVDFEAVFLESDTRIKCQEKNSSEDAVETRRQFSHYFFYEDKMTC